MTAPDPADLAARLATLEQAHQSNLDALTRIETQLASLAQCLAERLAQPPPPPKTIPWWDFVGVLMLWGALFHLIFR
jgi:hypothetical protein